MVACRKVSTFGFLGRTGGGGQWLLLLMRVEGLALLTLWLTSPLSELDGKTLTTCPSCTWASTEFKWLSVAVMGAKLALGLSSMEFLLFAAPPAAVAGVVPTRRIGAVLAVRASTFVGVAGDSIMLTAAAAEKIGAEWWVGLRSAEEARCFVTGKSAAGAALLLIDSLSVELDRRRANFNILEFKICIFLIHNRERRPIGCRPPGGRAEIRLKIFFK